MYISILTGRATKQNWGLLERDFEQEVTQKPPKGLLESFLLQSEDDPDEWQVIAIWKSKAAFKEFEQSEKADIFVGLLCEGGTVPNRLGFTSVSRYERV